MKLASIGPTRLRSVSCRLRRRPSISGQRPVAGRTTRFVATGTAAGEVAVPGGADPQRHGRTFAIIGVVRAVLPAALRATKHRSACMTMARNPCWVPARSAADRSTNSTLPFFPIS